MREVLALVTSWEMLIVYLAQRVLVPYGLYFYFSLSSLQIKVCNIFFPHLVDIVTLLHFTTYIHRPNILLGLHQQSIVSSMNSTFSLASSALSSGTSLLLVPTPYAHSPVILLPIVLLTLLTFVPHLLITTQLTRLACNFSKHKYAAWASSFELFLESFNLLHPLIDDHLPFLYLSYASWSQLDSAMT